ncbi:hypothetical protein GCM10027162_29850 [Streptomyces incanus]
MTVVVSSDTDIYISPGLYGDCLPTVATGGAADSFRAGNVFSRLRPHARTRPGKRKTVHPAPFRTPLQKPPPEPSGPAGGNEGNERASAGFHVTRTLWPSSK